MSLLLDALKRAEQAQLAKQAQPTVIQSEPVEAPIHHGSVSSMVAKASDAISLALVPEESAHEPRVTTQKSESIAPALHAATGAEPRITTQTKPSEKDDRAQRETALNVFTAKQPVASKRKGIIVFTGILAVIVIGLVVRGWYSWNPFSQANQASPFPGSASSGHASAMVDSLPVPVATLSPALPDIGQPGNRADSAKENKLAQAVAPLPPPMLADSAVQTISRGQTPSPRDVVGRALIAPPAPHEPGIVLKPTTEAPYSNTDLLQAYAALREGNYPLAHQHYMQVLRADSLNLDAHLGLATVAARSGELAEAVRHYRRALEIDPRNATALAALLTINGLVRPETIEAELKALLIKNPQSGALQFSLGNLYATNARWTEAQQAYFEAFRLEPDNPDYLYNLAVSLDQLNQPRLALEYYRRARQAFSLAAKLPFDSEAIARRIATLQQETRE